jgi:AcrR family transcriptional regulator
MPDTTEVFQDSNRAMPKQGRAVQTYERLLDVSGDLLAEVGIERISTNLICARAGMTPPALYRYFKDKYAVLEALGRRLLSRRSDILTMWLAETAPKGQQAIVDGLPSVLSATWAATLKEPGAVWILKALRAVPQLAHVRVETYRDMTDMVTSVFSTTLGAPPRDDLWLRVRIALEFAFSADELLFEEDRLPQEVIIAESAELLRRALMEALPMSGTQQN